MARSVRQVWSEVDEDQPVAVPEHFEEAPVEAVARAQQQSVPLTAAPIIMTRLESTDEDTPTRRFMPPSQPPHRQMNSATEPLTPVPIPTSVPVPPCTMRRRVTLLPPPQQDIQGAVSLMPHHPSVPVDSAMRAAILSAIPVFHSTTAFPWEDVAVPVGAPNQVVLRSITNFFIRLDRQLDSLQASPEQCLQILRTKVLGAASHTIDHYVQNVGDNSFTHLDYIRLRSQLIVSFTPADYDLNLEARLRTTKQAVDVPLLSHLHQFKSLIDSLREGDVYRDEVGQLKLKRIFVSSLNASYATSVADYEQMWKMTHQHDTDDIPTEMSFAQLSKAIVNNLIKPNAATGATPALPAFVASSVLTTSSPATMDVDVQHPSQPQSASRTVHGPRPSYAPVSSTDAAWSMSDQPTGQEFPRRQGNVSWSNQRRPTMQLPLNGRDSDDTRWAPTRDGRRHPYPRPDHDRRAQDRGYRRYQRCFSDRALPPRVPHHSPPTQVRPTTVTSSPTPSTTGCYFCTHNGHVYWQCPRVAEIPDSWKSPLHDFAGGAHNYINRRRERNGLPRVEFLTPSTLSRDSAMSRLVGPAFLVTSSSNLRGPISSTPIASSRDFQAVTAPRRQIDSASTDTTRDPPHWPPPSPATSAHMLIRAPVEFLDPLGNVILISEGPVDSGASDSLICESMATMLGATWTPTKMRYQTADGNLMIPLGITRPINIASQLPCSPPADKSSLHITVRRQYQLQFIVLPDYVLSVPLLLGLSRGSATNTIIDPRRHRVYFAPDESSTSTKQPSHGTELHDMDTQPTFLVTSFPQLAAEYSKPTLLWSSPELLAEELVRPERGMETPLEPVHEPYVNSTFSEQTKEEFQKTLLEHGVIHPNAPLEAQTALTEILYEHRDTLATSAMDIQQPANVPPISLLPSIIPNVSIRSVTRLNYSPQEKAAIEQQIDVWRKAKIVEPVPGGATAGVVFNSLLTVRKKDGTFRVCLDPRPLNKATILDESPLPQVTQVLNELQGSLVFSTLDLCQGYLQIPLDEPSRKFVCFMTPMGAYRFTRLPFGLKNACAIFNLCLREAERAEGLQSFLASYFDDLTVHSATVSLHLVYLRRVFAFLRKYNLKINLKKCQFLSPRIQLLGHVVDSEGLHCDPTKLAAISKMPIPTSVKQLQAFVGMCNYYRDFVPHFSDIVSPLTSLASASPSTFQDLWTPKHTQAFQAVKQALTLAAQDTLALFDFGSKVALVMETDASDIGISAILSQSNQDGKLRPIAYLSRRLSPAERNYSVTERELLAIIFGVSKIRSYLIGRPLKVFTDHIALKFLLDSSSVSQLNKRVIRWTLALSQFEISIYHRPGAENANADALSRLPIDNDVDVNQDEFELPPAHSVLYLNDPPQVISRVSVAPSFMLTREQRKRFGALTASTLPLDPSPPFSPAVLEARRRGREAVALHDSGVDLSQSRLSSHSQLSSSDAPSPSQSSLSQHREEGNPTPHPTVDPGPSPMSVGDEVNVEVRPSHTPPRAMSPLPLHAFAPDEEVSLSPIKFPLPRGTEVFTPSPQREDPDQAPIDTYEDFITVEESPDPAAIDFQRLSRSDPYLCSYLGYFIIHQSHAPDSERQLSKSRRRRVEEIARSFTYNHDLQRFYFVPPSRASAVLPTWLSVPLLVPLLSQRAELIARAHILGHFGVAATSQRLLRDFRVYWPSLRIDVERAVRSCGSCLQFRSAPIPHHPARSYTVPALFHRCSMDLMIGLPEVDGFCNILVLTEYLSKYATAYAIKTKTAVEVSSCLLDYVFTFGAPREILSDQGSEFVNSVVASMCERLKILRRTSSPYHPSTNGLVERANRDLVGALEACCRDCPDDWPTMMQFVIFAYRTLPRESLNGYTPFEVMFGRPHNSFLSFVDEPPASSSHQLSLLERASETRNMFEGLLPSVQKRIKETKIEQQKQQDKHNEAQLIPSSLAVGEVVFARVLTRHRKLRGPQFTGPYKIAKVHSGGNYSLRCPTGRLLRRSYPIDQLRVVAPHIADNVWRQLTVEHIPPSDVIYVPDRIVDHRTNPAGQTEYLIRWEGFSPEFDSWEEQSSILTPDVIAQYWGMAHDQPLVSPAMLATIASTFKDQQSSVPPAPLSSLCVTNPQLFPTPDFLSDPSPSIPPPPPCPLPVFIATPLSSEFMLCRGPFASRSQDPSF